MVLAVGFVLLSIGIPVKTMARKTIEVDANLIIQVPGSYGKLDMLCSMSPSPADNEEIEVKPRERVTVQINFNIQSKVSLEDANAIGGVYMFVISADAKYGKVFFGPVALKLDRFVDGSKSESVTYKVTYLAPRFKDYDKIKVSCLFWAFLLLRDGKWITTQGAPAAVYNVKILPD